MTVYVDKIIRYPTAAMKDAQTRRNGPDWSHMWADTLDELHEMAEKLGLRREWFQDRPRFPHYDIVPSKRIQARRLGAVEKNLRAYIREALRNG